MTRIFSLTLLQAVSDWQRGGDAKQKKRRGQALKVACASLPIKYRSCALICFRNIALPKGGVWDLIGEDRLDETISAWTPDITVAKVIKGGVPPDKQGLQGVILGIYPAPENIIVNLWALYTDPAFVAALDSHKAEIIGYHDGAGRFGNDQREVVLEIASVTQQDIYSLGGHSSPFEDLVEQAAWDIHGRIPTSHERNALLLSAEEVRTEAGPHWLCPDATQRVLERLKSPAKLLREVKRQQDTP